MKRKILWIVAAAVILGAAALPVVLKGQIRKGLEEAFPGAKAALGGFSFEKPCALGLTGVTVRAEGYEFSIGKAVLGTDLALDIYDPSAFIRVAPNAQSRKEKPASANMRTVPLKAVRVHGLALKYNVGGMTADITGDLVYDPKAGRFTRVRLAMPALKKGNLSIKDAALETGADGAGTLTVGEASQQKLKLSGLRARARLGGESIRFSDAEAALAGGKVTGSMDVLFTSPVSYETRLSISLMDLAALAKDLEIGEKVELGGRINGNVTLSGDAGVLKRLTGELSGTEKGGDLIIRDRRTLEDLAKNVKQPIELVESAFKEYHFDTAGAVLGLDGGNLGLKIHLEGVKGKRDLEITLHDLL